SWLGREGRSGSYGLVARAEGGVVVASSLRLDAVAKDLSLFGCACVVTLPGNSLDVGAHSAWHWSRGVVGIGSRKDFSTAVLTGDSLSDDSVGTSAGTQESLADVTVFAKTRDRKITSEESAADVLRGVVAAGLVRVASVFAVDCSGCGSASLACGAIG